MVTNSVIYSHKFDYQLTEQKNKKKKKNFVNGFLLFIVTIFITIFSQQI